MKNLQGDFQVLIHLIIRRQCLHAANTEKSAPKTKISGILGIQKGKKKYWTNVKTTPNMDRVMGTWFELLNKRHMIKNTELEFEQRTDISCDKLERILLPPYIFIESRGGK